MEFSQQTIDELKRTNEALKLLYSHYQDLNKEGKGFSMLTFGEYVDFHIKRIGNTLLHCPNCCVEEMEDEFDEEDEEIDKFDED